MHSLHLQRFTNLFQELENWANGGDMSEVPGNLRDMVTKYDSSLEETLNGKMSKTVQFCKIYAYIAGLIQLMQHAVRMYGTELYSFALFEVTSIFHGKQSQLCSLDILVFLRPCQFRKTFTRF